VTDGEPAASADSAPDASERQARGADGPAESAADAPGTDPDATPAGPVPGGITSHKPPEQEAFDWRGWLLVGAVVLSFLVVPAFVLFLPELHGVLGRAGLSLTQAYLVFPMVPALVLGSLAVWAAVRSRTAE